MNEHKLLIVIPCFNEEDSIESLILEIQSLKLTMDFEILVIDDGSTDLTYVKSMKMAGTIKLLRNLGIGGAIQTGIKFAELEDYGFCVQIDGDGQHPPQEINKLIEAYTRNLSSLTVGSRYIDNDSFRSTLFRRAGTRIISKLINFLWAIRVSDPTSGMRLMDKKAIKLFAKNYPYDWPEPISLAWALESGLSVSECSVRMRSRVAGESSIGGFRPLVYMIRVLSYITLIKLIGV